MEIVPYSFGRVLANPAPFVAAPGLFMGVHIYIRPDALEFLLMKIEQWYEGRDEVILIDHGTSRKQSIGYIILEFEECESDLLLLSILDHEDVVLDYVCYTRDVEVQV